MLNTEPDAPASTTEAVDGIMRTGMSGAVALAGIATVIVVGIWIAFYLLVFVPRGTLA